MTWGSWSSPGSTSLSIILPHLEGSFMFPIYAFICSSVQQLLRLPCARHAEDPRTQWEDGGRSLAFQEGIKPLNKEPPHLYLYSTGQWGPTGCPLTGAAPWAFASSWSCAGTGLAMDTAQGSGSHHPRVKQSWFCSLRRGYGGSWGGRLVTAPGFSSRSAHSLPQANAVGFPSVGA